jgi:hypothetical protein
MVKNCKMLEGFPYLLARFYNSSGGLLEYPGFSGYLRRAGIIRTRSALYWFAGLDQAGLTGYTSYSLQ